jgi:hypothetical protein
MSKDRSVIADGLALLVVIAFVVVLIGAIIAIPVYFLWNWVAVELGARAITFWQAWGLFALCHILLNGGRYNKNDD